MNTTEVSQFVINNNTGWITINDELCLNRYMNYTITVTTIDTPLNSSYVPATSSTTVTIQVYDDNQFSPDFTESEYVFTVRNSSPADTRAGTVAITDRDKCSRVYIALFSVTSTMFEIEMLTGVITTITELLRQDGTVTKKLVRCQNRSGRTNFGCQNWSPLPILVPL